MSTPPPLRCRVALVLLLLAPATAVGEEEAPLATIAERSGYRATATSAEVVALAESIAKLGPRVRGDVLGRTNEGRAIPMLVAADPPVTSLRRDPDDARLRVLLFGNIHAGEVCGKEALLALARELARDPEHPWLEDAVVVLVPNLNADGNDRMDPGNRPGQIGPEAGMGERPNAQGLDLNRDWMKLESPELRAMVALLTAWDPHLVIDTHTTNGSRHRYALTYAAPLNPSGDEPSIRYVRDRLLPAATTRLEEATGYASFFYGDFDRAHRTWTTYSADPRFGGPYRGLRGQMSVLSEAYAYATYEDRVKATLGFVRAVVDQARADRAEVLALHEAARRETTRRGADPQPHDLVGLRHRVAAFPEPVVVRGYALEADSEGRLRPGETPADHLVVHRGRFEPTRSVRRPFGYLVPPGNEALLDLLAAHGVATLPFAGAARVETWRVDAIRRAERPFQGHRMLEVEATARQQELDLPAGTRLVPCAQPLGTLAVCLLEPMSSDGAAAWNLLDEVLAEGADFPVHRVAAPGDLPASFRAPAEYE